MDRMRRLILLSLIAATLTACGTGPPIHYYTVAIPAAPDASTYVYPVALLVGRVEAPAILQSEPIVYRTGANEVGTYQYRRWVEPPADMLRTNLIRMLRASGNYQSVTELGSASAGEYVIRGSLYDFEEVDSPGNMAARVSLELTLSNRKTRQTVWSHYYSQTEPVQGKEISDVVGALDRNLDRGLKEASSSVADYFAQNLSRKP